MWVTGCGCECVGVSVWVRLCICAGLSVCEFVKLHERMKYGKWTVVVLLCV